MQLTIKDEQEGAGLHPSERAVYVDTRDGTEEVILDYRSVVDGKIDVEWPVGRDGEFFLVELPRQTSRGISQVWVHEDLLSDSRVPA